MLKYFSIKPESLGQLGRFEKKLKSNTTKDVEIPSEFLRPYCVAYLDQLLFSINENTKKLIFSKHPKANRYLKQCGFSYLSKKAELSDPFPDEFIAKIKRFKPCDNRDEKYIRWVRSQIIKHMPKCNQKMEKKIIESLWEIIQNACIHSESELGISSCGQYYPQKKYFEIAFVDCGCGISDKVSNFLKNKSYNHSDCIEWATEKGNSTIVDKPAGLGLHLFKKFIKLNGGAFQIISGTGYFGNMEETKSKKVSLKNSIQGSLVNIRINFDDNMYILK